MQNVQPKPRGLVERGLIGGLVLVALIFLGVSLARAAEVVPSIGVSAGSHGGDPKFSTGVALRTTVIPFLKGEVGVAYHRESYAFTGGTLNATTWPVTASVWFAPVPFVYAGGGGGWYHSTVSLAGAPIIASVTEQAFGTHVGGGLRMPIAPLLALDLNARYVVLQKRTNSLTSATYDPSFWNVALGLAVKF